MRLSFARKIIKPSLVFASLLIPGLMLSAEAKPQLYQQARYSMGTVFRIRIYHEDTEQAEQSAELAAQTAFELIEQADQRLSDWDDQSELMQAQAKAWPDPAPISYALWQDLNQALYYHHITQGAFDISVGPLLKLWGFRGENTAQVPAESDLARVQQQVGMQHVQLQTNPRSLKLGQASMQLDFGGIGKGIAIDQAATALGRLGITVAAIDCDSSSYFIGSPPGSMHGWPVLIRHPRDPERALTALWLKDQGLSTSGDDQQYFEVNGQRYSHILDPRSGQPIKAPGSLTVIANNATAADAWSTALLVLDRQNGSQLAQTHGVQFIRAVPDAQGNWQLEASHSGLL